MKKLNPKACVREDPSLPGLLIFIEDWKVDDLYFRLEYRSTEDGKRANAYLLYNPCGEERLPATVTHLESDGHLCLFEKSTKNTYASPYDLESVVKRARYWASCYKFFKDEERKYGYRKALENLRKIEPNW